MGNLFYLIEVFLLYFDKDLVFIKKKTEFKSEIVKSFCIYFMLMFLN